MIKTIKGSFRMAFTEWKKWVRNPRMLLVIMLFILTQSIVIGPLTEKAARMGSRINILEPAVAVGNSWITVMLLPAFFLIIMSDFPDIEDNTIQCVIRVGRTGWFLGQVLFSLFAIVTYLAGFTALIFLSGLGKFDLNLEWSDVTRHYVSRYPEGISGFAYRLLPSNLYNQLSFPKTLAFTFLLLALYLFLLMMILLFFTTAGMKGTGLPIAFLVVFTGAVSCGMDVKQKWVFPMAHSVIWMHYKKIIRKPVVPVAASVIYFAIISITLAVIAAAMARRMNFDKKRE